MLRTILFTSAICLITSFASAQVEHQVRFKNEFNRVVEKVVIGPVSYCNVKPGKTSPYTTIAPGTQTVRVQLVGQGYTVIDGAVTFRLALPSPWTVTLTKDREIRLTEDAAPTTITH